MKMNKSVIIALVSAGFLINTGFASTDPIVSPKKDDNFQVLAYSKNEAKGQEQALKAAEKKCDKKSMKLVVDSTKVFFKGIEKGGVDESENTDAADAALKSEGKKDEDYKTVINFHCVSKK